MGDFVPPPHRPAKPDRVEEDRPSEKAPEPARWMLEALGGDPRLPHGADRQEGAIGDPQKPQAEQPKPGEP